MWLVLMLFALAFLLFLVVRSSRKKKDEQKKAAESEKQRQHYAAVESARKRQIYDEAWEYQKRAVADAESAPLPDARPSTWILVDCEDCVYSNGKKCTTCKGQGSYKIHNPLYERWVKARKRKK